MSRDDLRFGDVKPGSGGGGIDSLIDLVIQLCILAIVLYIFYELVTTLLPML